MNTSLGPRRHQILDYIAQYLATHEGHSPSMRDIAAACGLRAQSTVFVHIQGLVQDGYLTYQAVEPTSHAMNLTPRSTALAQEPA